MRDRAARLACVALLVATGLAGCVDLEGNRAGHCANEYEGRWEGTFTYRTTFDVDRGHGSEEGALRVKVALVCTQVVPHPSGGYGNAHLRVTSLESDHDYFGCRQACAVASCDQVCSSPAELSVVSLRYPPPRPGTTVDDSSLDLTFPNGRAIDAPRQGGILFRAPTDLVGSTDSLAWSAEEDFEEPEPVLHEVPDGARNGRTTTLSWSLHRVG